MINTINVQVVRFIYINLFLIMRSLLSLLNIDKVIFLICTCKEWEERKNKMFTLFDYIDDCLNTMVLLKHIKQKRYII